MWYLKFSSLNIRLLTQCVCLLTLTYIVEEQYFMCCRYLGLTALQTTNCHDPRSGHISNEEWASFVSPLALIWLYFMLWYESSMLFCVPVSVQLHYLFCWQNGLGWWVCVAKIFFKALLWHMFVRNNGLPVLFNRLIYV